MNYDDPDRWVAWVSCAKGRCAPAHEMKLAALGIHLQAGDANVKDLSGGQRQVVAVARASLWAKQLLILDEPTAALGVRQSAIVMNTISKARDRGITILLISHNMPQVIRAAARIAIMSHGSIISTISAADATVSQVVTLMLGDVEDRFEESSDLDDQSAETDQPDQVTNLVQP